MSASRRQQMTVVHDEILAILDGDEGRVAIALLDILCAAKDERDAILDAIDQRRLFEDPQRRQIIDHAEIIDDHELRLRSLEGGDHGSEVGRSE